MVHWDVDLAALAVQTVCTHGMCLPVETVSGAGLQHLISTSGTDATTWHHQQPLLCNNGPKPLHVLVIGGGWRSLNLLHLTLHMFFYQVYKYKRILSVVNQDSQRTFTLEPCHLHAVALGKRCQLPDPPHTPRHASEARWS